MWRQTACYAVTVRFVGLVERARGEEQNSQKATQRSNHPGALATACPQFVAVQTPPRSSFELLLLCRMLEKLLLFATRSLRMFGFGSVGVIFAVYTSSDSQTSASECC